MGIFSEYLDKRWGSEQLSVERKKQLKRISQLRGGRDVLVYAADFNKQESNASIRHSDLARIQDQLDNLKGSTLDLIIETPGGSGEVAEDIVSLLRSKYSNIAAIIPGWTKSAGTLIAMSCDDILMEPASAVGPIDAQLQWQGKVFSAGELLEGLEKIKAEVLTVGLNKAYIPILQGISPGEIMRAENAQNFSKHLVTEWLFKYKFKIGIRGKARESLLLMSIKGNEQKKLPKIERSHTLVDARKVYKNAGFSGYASEITDYSKDEKLLDAIRRYYALLQITFQSNVYKIFETPTSQIYDYSIPDSDAPPAQIPKDAKTIMADINCGKCRNKIRIQMNLKDKQPLQKGFVLYPKNDRLQCPKCGNEMNLSKMRRDVEIQTGKPIIT